MGLSNNSWRGALYARFFSGDDLVRGLRPGELGPYEPLAIISPSGATMYSAVPSGTDLMAASNMEFQFPLQHGVEGAAFFDAGSGLLVLNRLGRTRASFINSTNGLFHGSTGFELRWTVPAVGVPLRINYSFDVFRLNRALFMPDGLVLRLHNRLGALEWGLGTLFWSGLGSLACPKLEIWGSGFITGSPQRFLNPDVPNLSVINTGDSPAPRPDGQELYLLPALRSIKDSSSKSSGCLESPLRLGCRFQCRHLGRVPG